MSELFKRAKAYIAATLHDAYKAKMKESAHSGDPEGRRIKMALTSQGTVREFNVQWPKNALFAHLILDSRGTRRTSFAEYAEALYPSRKTGLYLARLNRAKRQFLDRANVRKKGMPRKKEEPAPPLEKQAERQLIAHNIASTYGKGDLHTAILFLLRMHSDFGRVSFVPKKYRAAVLKKRMKVLNTTPRQLAALLHAHKRIMEALEKDGAFKHENGKILVDDECAKRLKRLRVRAL